MIAIYKSDIESVRQRAKLSELLKEIPQKMHPKAYRYQNEIDAYNFTVGRILLKRGMKEMGILKSLNDLQIGLNEKPFIKGIHFNISHTDNLVVCALSKDKSMGIDVEKKKEVVLDNFKSWFSDTEWEDIQNAQSSLSRFYWYWTRKESIIKAVGLNLSQLHNLELDSSRNDFVFQDKIFFLKNLDFGSQYTASICAELPLSEIQIR